jgi:hypothetical protein
MHIHPPCPWCLENDSKLLDEKLFNYNVIRKWWCLSCFEEWKASESPMEYDNYDPYDFFGTEIRGIHQRYILSLLFEQDGYTMGYYELYDSYKAWSIRITNKKSHHKQFSRVIKSLYKRRFIRIDSFKTKITLADQFRSDRKKVFYSGKPTYEPI